MKPSHQDDRRLLWTMMVALVVAGGLLLGYVARAALGTIAEARP